jgi:hypothetical protein
MQPYYDPTRINMKKKTEKCLELPESAPPRPSPRNVPPEISAGVNVGPSRGSIERTPGSEKFAKPLFHIWLYLKKSLLG